MCTSSLEKGVRSQEAPEACLYVPRTEADSSEAGILSVPAPFNSVADNNELFHVSDDVVFVDPDVVFAYLIERVLEVILNVIQAYQYKTV
jgi:hypothetical protein